MTKVERRHREAALLASHEVLGSRYLPWVESGNWADVNPSWAYGAIAVGANRRPLERTAQALANAEMDGAAAQQQLITNLMFGGLVEGPLVDEAIALSKQVSDAAKKQASPEAWISPAEQLPEKWTPVLCSLPSLGTSYRRVVAEFAPGGESYHKRGWYIHGNFVAEENACVGWLPLPPVIL